MSNPRNDPVFYRACVMQESFYDNAKGASDHGALYAVASAIIVSTRLLVIVLREKISNED